jgi:membrane protease YdiL (CAAX protease family)
MAIFVLVVFRRVRKFQGVPVTEKIKTGTYYHLICGLWGGALAVIIMSFLAGLTLADIGLRQMRFDYGFWFTAITLSLGGLLFVFGLYQMIASLVSKKRKEAAEKQYGNHAVLSEILPRSKKEKFLFACVSLSAGVCEEIIFRGFLLYLLLALFPDVSIILVIFITSALFGIAHFYQGLQGVIGTAIFGVFFMCLLLVTGSLVLPILLHFFHDLSSTFTLSEKKL